MRPIVTLIALLAIALSVAMQSAAASDADAEEAIHEALRDLRDAMLTAVNAHDIDALTAHVHPNVVLTVENGNRFRGVDGIRGFYQDVFAEDGGYLKSFEVQKFEVDELAIVYGGDSAIGFGSAVAKYVPKAGPTLVVPSQWTATLALEDGAWRVTSFQNTVDFTDNPLLDAIYEEIWLTLVVPVGAGALLIGWFTGRRFGPTRGKPAKA